MNDDGKKIINEGAEVPLVYVEDGALIPTLPQERALKKKSGAEPPPLTKTKPESKDVPNSIRRILRG